MPHWHLTSMPLGVLELYLINADGRPPRWLFSALALGLKERKTLCSCWWPDTRSRIFGTVKSGNPFLNRRAIPAIYRSCNEGVCSVQRIAMVKSRYSFTFAPSNQVHISASLSETHTEGEKAHAKLRRRAHVPCFGAGIAHGSQLRSSNFTCSSGA